MEGYNKSTRPVNAEKYFMAHRGFKLTTSATPPSTALSVTSTNYAIETTAKKKIVRIYIYRQRERERQTEKERETVRQREKE